MAQARKVHSNALEATGAGTKSRFYAALRCTALLKHPSISPPSPLLALDGSKVGVDAVVPLLG